MDSVSFKKRLVTFNGWPHNFTSCSPDKLANAGFHYTKEGDIVQCNSCGVRIGRWQFEDDPIAEHKKHSPNCKFLMKLTGVQITREAGKGPHHHRCIEEDSGAFRFRFRNLEDNSARPRYPLLAGKEERLRTFKYWPKSVKQKPIELVDAGFFYADVGDCTVCFYCGVVCKRWQEEDVPWEEHAKLSPDCAYLQLHKGKEFVDKFRPQRAEEALRTSEAQTEGVHPQIDEKT